MLKETSLLSLSNEDLVCLYLVVNTDSLDLLSVTTRRHDRSLDRITLKPGLDLYTIRLENRLWVKWYPSGISSGSFSPKESSSFKVISER